MSPNTFPKYSHLLVSDTAQKENYTRPNSGGSRIRIMPREQQLHGQKLKEQLYEIQKQTDTQIDGVTQQKGIRVEFEGEPGYELKLESLENSKLGIEITNVRKEKVFDSFNEQKEVILATVYIPEGKLEHFLKKIEEYLSEVNRFGNRKNRDLIESITKIRLASLKAFWTDRDRFPELNEKIWWEIWLRVGNSKREREEIVKLFEEECRKLNIEISKEILKFPERTVLLASGSAKQFAKSNVLMNCLAELRKPRRATAEDFLNMSTIEQGEYICELLSRIIVPGEKAPSVCILDTGISQNHPLLKIALERKVLDSYNKDWGSHDQVGHGSLMAGTILYGDLADIFSSNDKVTLTHKVESVKILPPSNQNEPHLYGNVTKTCVAISEIESPKQQRLFCLAVTASDYQDLGSPSSWSSAIDQICAGIDESNGNTINDFGKLMLISGGNINEVKSYPSDNYTLTIHDPGQAWNALTIGAYTEKYYIDQSKYPELKPIAPIGGLSPYSTTSIIWEKEWPLKPEIVFEGGNLAINVESKDVQHLDSLSLLSTSKNLFGSLLATTEATSAATALACRLAAKVMAHYSNFWPETVRGLLIHSAEWTKEMCKGENPWKKKKTEIEKDLLRCYGFGVPNEEKALWSANNSLTLIAQEIIQPFFKQNSEIKTKEMHLHCLPWPKDILLLLGELEVELRITLSYFIEPNPSERGWNRRFSYASHGLRFSTKKPTENVSDFKKRVNKLAREEGEKSQKNNSDSDQWLLGQNLRTKGSIHSDLWKGTAADLAEQEYIAIYPTNGWWKERKHLERWDKKVRYSLIATISTENANVDIYTPVANIVLNKIKNIIEL